MGFLDNTGVARLWQHILVKVNERLTVDPSVVEEGAANLINADSLGGVLAKDYATKADIDAIDVVVVDSTLTQEGLAAESKATGTRITALENNKIESINGLTGKNITLDVGTMGAVLKTGDTMSGTLTIELLYILLFCYARLKMMQKPIVMQFLRGITREPLLSRPGKT